MEGQLGLSVILLAFAVEGCPLSGVLLYQFSTILVAMCYYWQMNVKPTHIPSSNSECTSNVACTSAVGAGISIHREIIVCVSNMLHINFCNVCCVSVLSVKCVMAQYHLQKHQAHTYL